MTTMYDTLDSTWKKRIQDMEAKILKYSKTRGEVQPASVKPRLEFLKNQFSEVELMLENISHSVHRDSLLVKEVDKKVTRELYFVKDPLSYSTGPLLSEYHEKKVEELEERTKQIQRQAKGVQDFLSTHNRGRSNQVTDMLDALNNQYEAIHGSCENIEALAQQAEELLYKFLGKEKAEEIMKKADPDVARGMEGIV